MNIQTQACFYKEYLSFFRTKKFLIVALTLLGLSVLSPLLLNGMNSLWEGMTDVYAELGMELTVGEGLEGLFAATATSAGVAASTADLTNLGLIVFLILINHAAGGEQKRRDVIIPSSAGLQSFGYLFPKYIIYPLSAFVLSILAIFVSWGMSSILFETNDLTFARVLLAGVLTGMCMMFYVVFHITLGTATGRPGMSAAVCIVATVVLPSIFMITGTDYMFNPFGLNGLAATVASQPYISSGELRDIAITVCFSLAIIVVCFFIALFTQNAKRIDNTGNEMML